MNLTQFNQPFSALNQRVLYHPQWLTQDQADELYQHCHSSDWQAETITLFGKQITVPRRVFWMGDADAHYSYSNTSHIPVPWSKELLELKNRIKRELGLQFNSVLGNLYRDGQDHMGWHRDNETELGENPNILSISLGAERRFCFKHIQHGEKHALVLKHGSALLMQGNCQQQYKHALPKSIRIKSPRINLTFRLIQCEKKK